MTKKKKELRIVKIFKNIFNVRFWLDYDRLHTFFKYVGSSLKTMFVPQKRKAKPNDHESFNKAVLNLNLSEKNLLAKQKNLYLTSVLLSGMAVLLILYTGYLLVYGSYQGAVVGLSVTLITSTLAFRYHFWYFQIKNKKLGCSFREWFNQGLLGKK